MYGTNLHSLATTHDGNIVVGSTSGAIACFAPITDGSFPPETVYDKIWEIPSAHSKQIKGLAVIGRALLASASEDHSIKCWSLTTQKEMFSVPEAHDSVVRALCLVRPNLLASASYDGSVKLWNVFPPWEEVRWLWLGFSSPMSEFSTLPRELLGVISSVW